MVWICDQLEQLGCTDSTYMEYDSLATEDNGSCTTLIVEGCMDSLYLEYNPLATIDSSPSSCLTMIMEGCTIVQHVITIQRQIQRILPVNMPINIMIVVETVF